MILTIEIINNIFQKLLKGQISREEASHWAYRMMLENDKNVLQYLPETDEELIWNAVKFLHAVDHQMEPDVYDTSMQTIEKDFNATWKRDIKRVHTKIGDIFEVETRFHQKAYFQYIMRDLKELNGDVIRVFQTRYPRDKTIPLEVIVNNEVEFYVHTSVSPGARDGLWRKVGYVKVPEDIERPCFRGTRDEGNPEIKVSKRWYIWRANDEKSTYVGEFLPKYHHCDKGGIYPPFAIVNRIDTGDDGFFEHGF